MTAHREDDNGFHKRSGCWWYLERGEFMRDLEKCADRIEHVAQEVHQMALRQAVLRAQMAMWGAIGGAFGAGLVTFLVRHLTGPG